MKNRISVGLIIVLALLAMTYCGVEPYYVTPSFYEKSNGHRIIAVLPYEMIFTGKKPKKLSVQQIRKIEEMESLAFQQSLYEMLLDESTHGPQPIRIAIQPIRKTNRILERNGIGIRESWEMDATQLARLLQVDAVVRTRIIKKRYMSQSTSFGIEMGTAILDAIVNKDDSPFFFGGVRLATNAIKAECAICNGLDGDVLWNIDIVDDTDWRQTANSIIQHINSFFAAKFPYR